MWSGPLMITQVAPEQQEISICFRRGVVPPICFGKDPLGDRIRRSSTALESRYGGAFLLVKLAETSCSSLLPLDVLARRYVVSPGRFLGEGADGRVVTCLDFVEAEEVAVKICGNSQYDRRKARREIDILELVNSHPKGVEHCVKKLDDFQHCSHPCIVFENLDLSLRLYIVSSTFPKPSIDDVRTLAKQLLESVNYLHSINPVHGDLKPNNIMFVNKDTQRIKVIDFGNSYFKRISNKTIQVHYSQAPEVILGHVCEYAVDISSVGCIFYKVYTGRRLFPALRGDNVILLSMMNAVLGPIPKSMVFVESWRNRFNEVPDGFVTRCSIPEDWGTLQELVGDDIDANDFLDLLLGLLAFDPKKRLTAGNALEHPFFHTV